MLAVAEESPPLNTDAIRARREKLGYTMEQAGQAADFKENARQQWYMIETGRRGDVKVSTLLRLARALHCKPADLLK